MGITRKSLSSMNFDVSAKNSALNICKYIFIIAIIILIN